MFQARILRLMWLASPYGMGAEAEAGVGLAAGGPVIEAGGGAHVGGAGGAGGLPAWGPEEGGVGAGRAGGALPEEKPGPLPSICRRPVAV